MGARDCEPRRGKAPPHEGAVFVQSNGVARPGDGQSILLPFGVPAPYVDLRGGRTGNAFFLLGPPGQEARDALTAPPRGTVPAATPYVQSANLRYQVKYAAGSPPTRTPDDRDTGITVLLRRLANPHIPFDPQPSLRLSDGSIAANPWYNPYVTIDRLDGVPLRNATNPAAVYASRGKRQPYAAHLSQVADQAAAGNPAHTFGRPNNPAPPEKGTTG